MNAMDFDDLLVRSVNLLEMFPEVRDVYANGFRHVLVDEYQDTNHAQYRWLQLLAEEHRNLMVVGDDAQSIYGFRGADIRNILDFEDAFPDAHVVRLEQNYRSTQTILDAANAVIANNRGQKSKLLWTDVGRGDPIKIRELEDEHAEARMVTGEIQQLVDEGTSRAEIAVFYRTNAQSRVLEDTLVRAEIPYQVIGGTKFYERAEIKDAIAYLTTLINPQDVGAFTRIVNAPRRGIGATSMSRVLSFSNTIGLPIWDAASDPEQVPGLGAAAIKALRRFMGTMHVLRELAESGAPIAKLLTEVLRETGYLEALEAERTIEAQGRIENLEELVNVAAEYDAADADDKSLGEFLQQIALIADADERDRRRGPGDVDDAAQRQGPGVPDRVHHRLRGGRVPALASARRGRAGGGAAALLRRASPGPSGTCTSRSPAAARCSARATTGWPAGSSPRSPTSSPTASSSRRPTPGFAPARPRGRRRSASDQPAPVAYRLGDDVAHPKFGEGVVTGIEPGGIVVIHFSRDGTDRKLVADLAPISKR